MASVDMAGWAAGVTYERSRDAAAREPFAGSKASGYGPHEQGRAAIEFHSEEITVYRDV
jgi:acyl-CoA reductase-like NAD-dependent aldehyde dehydrogenase